MKIRIAQEEIIKPPIDKDKILFWLHRFRKMDTTKLEHRKRMIDSFVNAIYLYDDKVVFTFNYKDGSKTITMESLLHLSGTNGDSKSSVKKTVRGLSHHGRGPDLFYEFSVMKARRFRESFAAALDFFAPYVTIKLRESHPPNLFGKKELT